MKISCFWDHQLDITIKSKSDTDSSSVPTSSHYYQRPDNQCPSLRWLQSTMTPQSESEWVVVDCWCLSPAYTKWGHGIHPGQVISPLLWHTLTPSGNLEISNQPKHSENYDLMTHFPKVLTPMELSLLCFPINRQSAEVKVTHQSLSSLSACHLSLSYFLICLDPSFQPSFTSFTNVSLTLRRRPPTSPRSPGTLDASSRTCRRVWERSTFSEASLPAIWALVMA